MAAGLEILHIYLDNFQFKEFLVVCSNLSASFLVVIKAAKDFLGGKDVLLPVGFVKRSVKHCAVMSI